MLYIRIENGVAVEVSTKFPEACRTNPENWARSFTDQIKPNGWLSRTDMATLEFAEKIAAQLTETQGKVFLATDSGEHVSPRYDVIEAPAIGDKVSRGFNGDYYPCGEIVKITPKWMVTTSTGLKFRRQKNSGRWLQSPGGTFGMVGGHIDERNPHF